MVKFEVLIIATLCALSPILLPHSLPNIPWNETGAIATLLCKASLVGECDSSIENRMGNWFIFG